MPQYHYSIVERKSATFCDKSISRQNGTILLLVCKMGVGESGVGETGIAP